jgi:hypothetical protein
VGSLPQFVALVTRPARATYGDFVELAHWIDGFTRSNDCCREDCVRPSNVPRSLTGVSDRARYALTCIVGFDR